MGKKMICQDSDVVPVQLALCRTLRRGVARGGCDRGSPGDGRQDHHGLSQRRRGDEGQGPEVS